jgi:hypothetical protein
MASVVEWFLALTGLIVGISHIVQRDAWADTYDRLHRAGRPGAFANGAISLVPGALVAAGHPLWTWPENVLTVFGWLMVAKGALCFLAPERALASMGHGARSPRGFVTGGAMLLGVSAWAVWCAWRRGWTAG